jgi:sulfur carrier protein
MRPRSLLGGASVIMLNGQTSDLSVGDTVTDALARLDLDADARGVAVAVDGEVVPRAGWDSYTLPDQARVEVLTAMQGG